MKQFTGREFKKILKNSGFLLSRQKGDHSIYINSKGQHISIPKNIKSVVALRLIKENNLNTHIKKKK